MSTNIGPILVTGGCGLLGYHIVRALVEDSRIGAITVVSRNPSRNLCDGVKYLSRDLTDANFVDNVFAKVKPVVVFHAAAPRVLEEGDDDFWRRSVLEATENLIKASEKTLQTKAFIFSSTVNVIKGHEHINVDEKSMPYWRLSDKAIPYWRYKAQAEKLVLNANSKDLQTVSLRPCLILAVQDYALIPTQLDAFDKGKTKIQLGDNKNLLDVVIGDNCAKAHLLAMHALLELLKSNGKVTELKDVTVIPAWAAKIMAMFAGLFYYVLFFGGKSPELSLHVVSFCTNTYTYNIDKARQVLGYSPVKHTQEVIEEATRWEMNERLKSR